MRTAELIDVLAADLTPTDPARPGRMILAALALGVGAAVAGLVLWLGFRPLPEAIRTAAFWMKAGYTSILALAGVGAVLGFARPAGRAGPAPALGAAAFGLLALLAALQAMSTPPDGIAALWLGQSWRTCSWRIVALAAPIFLAVVLAMRRLAPTRLAAAGAAAGSLAGAAGATVYGLYCQETAAAFVLLWYSLGILACGGVGALLGRHLLRW